MLEREIEAYLVSRCKAIGASCDKFTSPQRRAVPDRLITFDSKVVFVELKASDGRPSDAQKRDHDRRRHLGAAVWVIRSFARVDTLIHMLSVGTDDEVLALEGARLPDGD